VTVLAIAPRQLIEVGLLLGIIGTVLIVAGAAMFLRSPSADGSVRQRTWTLAGASVIGVGFVAQLAGQLAR
jgi:hypothetical protein